MTPRTSRRPRRRRRLRAEAAVGKAGIKMLFPIVLFILPVLFVITLVPGILDTQCGFKAFTAEAAEDLFARGRIDGWAFDLEIL